MNLICDLKNHKTKLDMASLCENNEKGYNLPERVYIPNQDPYGTLSNDRSVVLNQIEKKNKTGKSKIYPNQKVTALEAFNAIISSPGIFWLSIISLCQSGKTGVMVAIIQMLYINWMHKYPIENIYIITGMSSKNWKEQTAQRLPDCLKDRIFHGPDVPKILLEIKKKINCLIFFDEIHIASKVNMRITKVLKQAGLYDFNKLAERNICFISLDATPDGVQADLDDWKKYGAVKTLKMKLPKKYRGLQYYLENDRLGDTIDLLCMKKNKKREPKFDVEKFVKNMDLLSEKIISFKSPRYHLIRTPNGDCQKQVVENIHFYFKKKYSLLQLGANIYYDGKSTQNFVSLNKYLDKPPKYHTFIFIKEKARAADTLNKSYIGVVVERYCKGKYNDSTQIQGLAGRVCGYPPDNGNVPFVFVNIESIKKYLLIYDNNFQNIKEVGWNSNTTCKGRSKKTVTHLNNYDMEGKSHIKERVPICNQYFDTYEEANSYSIEVVKAKNEFKGISIKKKISGCRKRKTDERGFVINTIRTEKVILSVEESEKDLYCSVGQAAGYEYRVVYEDKNNNSTAKHQVIHYYHGKEASYYEKIKSDTVTY